MEEEFVYMKGAGGLTDRVPVSELEKWKKRQEELKAKGVSPERTKQIFAKLEETLSKLETEE